MKSHQYEWLHHLDDVIPLEARRNRISLYTIALEGWRRGLILTFHNKLNENNKPFFTYSLQSKERIHYFYESSGDKNTKEAFKICDDKSLTSEYLSKADVPIPLGEKFSSKVSVEEIIKYSSKLTYPLVVKPTDESSGRGVITNILNEKQLKDSIIQLRQKYNYENIIVQEHVFGDEIRIYVLDNQVIAATNRLPANVIGDGKLSVAQLIEEKNEIRKKTPHLYFRPIVIDSTLRKTIEKQGFTLDSILKKNERLFVREVSNISTGGDPIDVTDRLTKEQKSIAVAATKAIPGLAHCGVDMIVPKGSKSGVILEVNTRPGIGSHLFPMEGKARDIPAKLIDYYFPESRETVRNDNVFFDLQAIFDGINDGHISEIQMKEVPKNKQIGYKWNVSSRLDVLSLYKYLRKLVIDNQLNGHFKSIDKNKMEILIAHENLNAINRFKAYINEKYKLLQINKCEEEQFEGPTMIGFRIIEGLNQMSENELERFYHENLKEIRKYELSVQRLERRIELMEKSSSWKLTKPIRYLSEKTKKNGVT